MIWYGQGDSTNYLQMDPSEQQHLSVHSSAFCRADDEIVRKSQQQICSNQAADIKKKLKKEETPPGQTGMKRQDW